MVRASIVLLGWAWLGLSAQAQDRNIYDRLRQALGPGGNGDQAVSELARGQFEQVGALLAQKAEAEPARRAELLALSGTIAFLGGDMQNAVLDFGKSAELAPLNDGDAFTRAMALVRLGDDARARAALEKLAEKHADQSLYVYWLGRLDYDQRRYAEAREKLSKATQLDPRSARAWDSLGLTLDMQGQLTQALEAYGKAASLNRGLSKPSAWPPDNLGYCLLRMDRASEAEAALRESLRYDPDFAEAHYRLGRTLEKESRDPEAVEEYRRAIALDKLSTEACYSLAMLYRKLQRQSEAAAAFAEYKRRKDVLPAPDLTAKTVR